MYNAKALGKLPCTGGHPRLDELLVANGECDRFGQIERFMAFATKTDRRGDAGLRCGRHRFWLRRRCRRIPPRAHGSAFGGPRAGAALAARRFSDDGQGTAQDHTANGPRTEPGRSCWALLPIGRQGADRVRRIRHRRLFADQRRCRAAARSWQIAQGRLAGCGGQRWTPPEGSCAGGGNARCRAGARPRALCQVCRHAQGGRSLGPLRAVAANDDLP